MSSVHVYYNAPLRAQTSSGSKTTILPVDGTTREYCGYSALTNSAWKMLSSFVARTNSFSPRTRWIIPPPALVGASSDGIIQRECIDVTLTAGERSRCVLQEIGDGTDAMKIPGPKKLQQPVSIH
ncbi:hypothetical protein LSAT2_012585 [Lamellibrachia satsuma]|nr:hypothetical protein LSAT2_012585 [Lamellibrachia satsuma]